MSREINFSLLNEENREYNEGENIENKHKDMNEINKSKKDEKKTIGLM